MARRTRRATRPADERPVPAARRAGLSRYRTSYSAAELDALAEITPQDIEDARAAFERDAPARVRGLLDAEER